LSSPTTPTGDTEGRHPKRIEFGANLKRLRTSKNLTQAALAKTVGVKQSALANWEAGDHSPPVTKIPDLARALGCEIVDLFAESKPVRKRRRK
jgi:transcriptional regulator with XRE-family HTH domain